MAERVSKVLKEFNIGMDTLSDFLKSKGIEIPSSPNYRLPDDAYVLVQEEFKKEQIAKEESKRVSEKVRSIISECESKSNSQKKEKQEKEHFIKTTVDKIEAPVVVGKIDLEEKEEKKTKSKKTKAEEGETKKSKETKAEEGKTKKSKNTKTKVAEEKPAEPTKSKTKKTKASDTAEKPQEEEKNSGKKRTSKVAKATVAEDKTEEKEQTPEVPVKEEPKKAKKTPSTFTSTASDAYVESMGGDFIETKVEHLEGPKLTGDKVDLSKFEKKPTPGRGKRERISKSTKEKVDVTKEFGQNHPGKRGGAQDTERRGRKRERFKPIKNEIDQDAIQKQIKETYQRMVEGKGKTKSSKYRREKRGLFAEKMEEAELQKQAEGKILKVAEFVTVNDLATMMGQPATKVIGACMNLGLMVSINQRLDADALTIVAEDFGYKVEFTTADIQESIKESVAQDKPEDLVPRAPIITVMGHVDHGKTSLLDYIRQSNVIAGEAGGITQHIGAYNVELPSGRSITFLDTPGHEAFTAMRARGAKMTDLTIIIVAADDAVMPQTIEAINHAQAAGVPMIFAINKIDKPGAMPEKIKEQLSQMDILVEDWGGKYQCQEISAKKGIGVQELLEKVLLEADMLELKANPNKKAIGTVIESSLDKGRGYLATVLVQGGTLHTGDIMLSGSYTGRIKAMFNERGQKITEAGPSVPVSVLGLNGAPTAGDSFNIFDNEREAKEIANKRDQLARIQGIRTQKHITLEELGRRIAIGNFKELNIIVKGDVDGSIEAMSDSLIKLSTEEIQVNVIHKAVGEISENDVLLAKASNAIIIGFQVRPSVNARKTAEKEGIDIRLYSVIYDAINEVKSGIEGMLAPVEKEVVTATLEIRQTFKISKIGTIAGCMVKEGKITRGAKVRLIREGIVVHTGVLSSLRREKDDVKEVASGFDCGAGIENYNDVKVGDIIEAYKIEEIKRSL